MCEVTPYNNGKRTHKAWYISYIPQSGAFDLNHSCSIYILLVLLIIIIYKCQVVDDCYYALVFSCLRRWSFEASASVHVTLFTVASLFSCFYKYFSAQVLHYKYAPRYAMNVPCLLHYNGTKIGIATNQSISV